MLAGTRDKIIQDMPDRAANSNKIVHSKRVFNIASFYQNNVSIGI